MVELTELTAAWESGEEVDLVGQFESWGEGDSARIVPTADGRAVGFDDDEGWGGFHEVRAAG